MISCIILLDIFFFSSRRRHTRSLCDWSSTCALPILTSAFCATEAAAQSSYDLRSPDGRIEVRIRTAKGLRNDVLLKGKALLQDSTVSLNVDHKTLGTEAQVLHSRESNSDRVLVPVVRQKFGKIRENYRELRLEMAGGYVVAFRAYNEGVAYRFETSLPQQIGRAHV